MAGPTPIIQTFVLGDYETNCFVVRAPDAQECWIVDCGFEPTEMLDCIEDQRLKPVAMLMTHAHSDHIAGIDEALNRFGRLPIYAHEAEEKWYSNPMLNLSGMIGMPITATPPDHLLHGGESLELNEMKWRVVHTPGHSPGGVCFIHDESLQAIVGDTLFAGSIGRIDFPTSSPDDMRHTIHEMLMKLPDAMTVYSGHGPATTIGRERVSNPFVRGGF